MKNLMKQQLEKFTLGYHLANDYNFTPVFDLSEFKPSILNGLGYNIGIIRVKLFGYANII